MTKLKGLISNVVKFNDILSPNINKYNLFISIKTSFIQK